MPNYPIILDEKYEEFFDKYAAVNFKSYAAVFEFLLCLPRSTYDWNSVFYHLYKRCFLVQGFSDP